MNVWLFVLLLSVFANVSNQAIASLPNLKSLITSKNYTAAIELGHQLQQQNPQSVSVLFFTALAYQNNHQPERAKTLYLKAIQQNARLPEIYNNLAGIYVAEKNYLKAADTLTLAINSQPNIATAYANLSKIYRHLASQAYQQVLDDSEKTKSPNTKLKAKLIASLNFNEIIKVIKPATPIIVAKLEPPKIIQTNLNQAVPIVKTLPSVQQTIIKWAKAWQNKRYNAYINSYSTNYAPRNLNHAQWLGQREKRINRPGEISIVVNNFAIKLSHKKATINFDQAYRSKTYQDKVRKRMHLSLIKGQWLITSEVTLNVL